MLDQARSDASQHAANSLATQTESVQTHALRMDATTKISLCTARHCALQALFSPPGLFEVGASSECPQLAAHPILPA